MFYIDQTFYLICLCLTKVSVLFFYLRIFPTTAFRWAALANMSFVVISTVVLLFLQIFQCRPIHKTWTGWENEDWGEYCLDLNKLAYAAACLSIAQDALLILLPMPHLVRLNIGVKTKIGVILMFSLGLFILATSCTRLSYMLAFGHTVNPTWDYTDPVIWSGLEVAVSIIVACLPAMRVLVKHFAPGLASTIRTPRGTNRAGNTNSKRSSGYDKLNAARSGSREAGLGKHAERVRERSVSGDGDGDSGSEIELRASAGYEQEYYFTLDKGPGEVTVEGLDQRNEHDAGQPRPPPNAILVAHEVLVGREPARTKSSRSRQPSRSDLRDETLESEQGREI